MSDPRRTGTSSITDKLVTIRHATTADLAGIKEYLAKHHADAGINEAEVVVAAEENRIIGFGIMKKGGEAGCVSLFEDSRRKGIGSSIVRHLLEHSALPRVYAARYVSYFTRYDFTRTQQVHAARSRKKDECTMPLLERLSIAAYAKA